MPRIPSGLAALAFAPLAWACATTADPGPVLMSPPDTRARCHAALTHLTPLVTEWSAAEKANLEGRLRGGGVAVEFSGCEMRVLPRCVVGGRYAWQRTTPAVETLDIDNADELYLRVPLGAVALESELARSGSLSIVTHVAGHMRLEGQAEHNVAASADCARATHIIDTVAVGAYALRNAGHVGGGAKVDVEGVGGGARVDRSARVLRSTGTPERCAEASDEAPHRDCASPIQVFLWPLPGRAQDAGPPGTVAVDFVAGDDETQWRVNVGERAVCTTPCTSWIDPTRPVVMIATEEEESKRSQFPFSKRNRIRLNNLTSRPPDASGLQIRAHSASPSRLRRGVTLTASGGGLTFIGAFLGGFGALAERPGLAVSGAITAGVGLAVLTAGLVIVRRSRPRAELVPRHGSQRARRGVMLTPTGLVGRF